MKALFLKKNINILYSIRDKIMFILLSGLFSSLFLVIFEPYNINSWGINKDIPIVIFYFGLGLSSMGVLLFSQFIIHPLFKTKIFSYYSLLISLVFETLLLNIVLLYVFSLHTEYDTPISEFIISFGRIFTLLIFPYIITISYFHQNKIENIKSINSDIKFTNIPDINNKIKLSIPTINLLYIESADNYISVYYLKESEIKSEMVRNSIKNLERSLLNQNILRCHRSFMINLNNILECKPKKNGFEIILKHIPNNIIPVSKSYSLKFKTQLTVNS